MAHDHLMPDAEAVDEQRTQYNTSAFVDEDLEAKYPNRPHNHSKTLPFRDLYLTLFDPLNENKRKPTGPVQARKKMGPHGPTTLSPNEKRKQIIDRFISNWRNRVGNDIYPAFRLIVPEKDRDRAMYGLKEKTIAKLLVRVMGIDKNAEDAQNLLNWKLPGVRSTSAMAGDFSARCFEIVKKRSTRSQPGDLTIGEVNEMLDRLAAAQKEENQFPIFKDFYESMNAEEVLWLIRIILRQMKVGASEKTIFEQWHPDAEDLFNVSSSLRQVCWELYDPEIRLASENTEITLMQCFQPQLAAFQMRSMEKLVARMNLSDDDPVFWIEEKLDGERMQLHMKQDKSVPGGFSFKFWSRKGKDYTYLYGNSFEDENASLTRQIRSAFNPDVRNIILDGEMITWDPEKDVPVEFGHLKTAALSEQRDPFANGWRPLLKVFDCLYINDKAITNFTLCDRRRALSSSINNVHRRLEVHEYIEGKTAQNIETQLQKVVAESTEGLVVKRPGSAYRLNERNEDWIKVKPEYMAEFGTSLDCVVVGGYYGSGHRGGNLSSFLCGLRLDHDMIVAEKCNPMKTYSFFKVGGGFSASDYADLWHRTEGKWMEWDRKQPPSDYVELGGGDKQYERPDMWIKPEDSVVLEVKAAQVITTKEFRTNKSLRFPRFVRLRSDKSWKEALSVQEFGQLAAQATKERKEKEFRIDNSRKQRRGIKSRKKQLTVIGTDDVVAMPYAGPRLKVFEGLTFYIITAAAKPISNSKAELEQLVKANDGNITQTHKDPKTICIAEGNQVRVASLKKEGSRNIIHPKWLLDSVRQAEIDQGQMNVPLPYEPQHVLFTRAEDQHSFEYNIDSYGDSFARDVTVDEMSLILTKMPRVDDEDQDTNKLLYELMGDEDLINLPGWMFYRTRVFVVERSKDGNMSPDLEIAARILVVCGGSLAASLTDSEVTHVMVGDDNADLHSLRSRLARSSIIPRIVTSRWATESLAAGTRLDEERFAPTT
ncbi:hypothetical protein AAFC00_003390 [Neodothiora populina]|uniref:DNA ligase n=1 Tax=Neodothiora populina TaxID=2781224 RepID=A0ABR3PF80_9PEZI